MRGRIVGGGDDLARVYTQFTRNAQRQARRTREHFTEPELFVMDETLDDAGVVRGSEVEPLGDTRLFRAIGVGIVAALLAIGAAVLVVAALHSPATTLTALTSGVTGVVAWAFWPHGTTE